MTARDLHVGSLVAEVTSHSTTGKASFSGFDFSGHSVAVFMVHGLGGSSNTFEPMMPALADYPVVRIDLPGAGRSAMRAGRSGMDVLTMAVSDMIQACGADQFHLVGHSMGTLICQYLAVQLPERVKSLCLFGPLLEPTPAARQALRERAAQARRHGMLAIAEAVSTNTVSAASQAKNPIIKTFVRESLMRQDANGYAMQCEALAVAVAADHKRIQCPVQLVAGEVDTVAPLEQVRLLASQLVNAETTELEQVAHWMTLEAAQECSACLLQQLNSFGTDP